MGNTGAGMTGSQSALLMWAMQRARLLEYDEWCRTSRRDTAARTDSDLRTAYIHDIVGALNLLGLGNTIEPESLFIEPLHAYTPAEAAAALDAACPPFPAAELQEAGLGVLSPRLVAGYAASQATAVGAGTSCASFLESTFGAKPVLCDHLYGMGLVRSDGRWRQVCFANSLWQEHAVGLPPAVARQHLSESLYALSQGTVISRALLEPVLPDYARQALRGHRVPEIAVEDQAQLYSWIDRIRDQVARSNMMLRMWFRGQSDDFLVPDRSRLVEKGITRYSDVRDSSLVPALFRGIDQLTATPSGLMRLVRHVGDWAHNAQAILPDLATILNPTGTARHVPRPVPDQATATASMYMAGRPHADVPGLRDLGPYTRVEVRAPDGALIDEYLKLYHPSLQGARQMLLLQHYGCPTPWIDVTHDPAVAMWFALHTVTKVSTATLKATRKYALHGSPPPRWPVIYVFLLHERRHPITDTSKILDSTEFLRPQAQRCGLIGGAGTLVRNYPARFIALKFRLGPGFAKAPLRPVHELFPPSSEDPGLRKLLERESHPMNDRLFPVYNVLAA